MRILQPLIAFSGNAPPQLAVTRELIARGHEVRVLAHLAARERVKRTGAEFVEFIRAYPEMDITRRETDTLRDWEPRTPLGRRKRLLTNVLFAFVEDVARDCAAVLAEWPADAMVFDWMLVGAPIAAEAARVPAFSLVHCPYSLPVRGAPPVGMGLAPARGPLAGARDRVLRQGARLGLALAERSRIDRTRRELGLPPLGNWEEQLIGSGVRAVYVMTAPELDFASGGELPSRVHYVGPAFEPFSTQWRSPWPQSNSDPLVLISFSTSYMNQRALLQRVLEAVEPLRIRALVTLGPALKHEQLRIPANARAVDFVPHRSVLPHASLVITHAGWQTTNAALADGVPMLCIPDGRDQPDNAARVLAVGAGVRASKRDSPEKLRAAIVRALGDRSLKRNAEAIARALNRSDGAKVVADGIERLAAKRPDHPPAAASAAGEPSTG